MILNHVDKYAIGEKLAEVLKLREVKKNDIPALYKTTWGNKTPAGIYDLIKKIILCED